MPNQSRNLMYPPHIAARLQFGKRSAGVELRNLPGATAKSRSREFGRSQGGPGWRFWLGIVGLASATVLLVWTII